MKRIVTALAVAFSVAAVAVPLMSLYGKVSWDSAFGVVILLALLCAAVVDYYLEDRTHPPHHGH